VCYYCELTAETVWQFVEPSKCSKTRGKNLEVERKKPNETYQDSYKNDNLALACYICNNAKSDIFTETEFEPIATAIKDVVEKYLEKTKNALQTP
jgi:5-methylcytosine-specific restriction endonuclease McrA